MSTSVRVMVLLSMTPQSLHNLDQFLPCISLPVARVSPWMAKRLKASSSGVSSTGVLAPAAPSFVPFDSVERRFTRSLECSLGARRGVLFGVGCLALWTLNSSMVLKVKKKRKPLLSHSESLFFRAGIRAQGLS